MIRIETYYAKNGAFWAASRAIPNTPQSRATLKALVRKKNAEDKRFISKVIIV